MVHTTMERLRIDCDYHSKCVTHKTHTHTHNKESLFTSMNYAHGHAAGRACSIGPLYSTDTFNNSTCALSIDID
jgi:hypothetical protein